MSKKIKLFKKDNDKGIVCHYYAITKKAMSLVSDIHQSIMEINDECLLEYGYSPIFPEYIENRNNLFKIVPYISPNDFRLIATVYSNNKQTVLYGNKTKARWEETNNKANTFFWNSLIDDEVSYIEMFDGLNLDEFEVSFKNSKHDLFNLVDNYKNTPSQIYGKESSDESLKRVYISTKRTFDVHNNLVSKLSEKGYHLASTGKLALSQIFTDFLVPVIDLGSGYGWVNTFLCEPTPYHYVTRKDDNGNTLYATNRNTGEPLKEYEYEDDGNIHANQILSMLLNNEKYVFHTVSGSDFTEIPAGDIVSTIVGNNAADSDKWRFLPISAYGKEIDNRELVYLQFEYLGEERIVPILEYDEDYVPKGVEL